MIAWILQNLATIIISLVLAAIVALIIVFLVKNKKNYWIAAAPATFMSAVSATYFMMAPECLGMVARFRNNTTIAYPAGIIVAVLFLWLFLRSAKKAEVSA